MGRTSIANRKGTNQLHFLKNIRGFSIRVGAFLRFYIEIVA